MRTNQSWVRAGFSAATAIALAGCAAVVPFIGGPPPTTAPPGAALCTNAEVKGVAERRAGAARDSVMTNGHKLVFPGGENPAGGAFRIAEPVAGYVVVQVGPSRHRFATERAQLTINYDHCPQNVTGPFAIYRWNDADDSWVKLENSRPVRGERAVTAPLDSLSVYALGST